MFVCQPTLDTIELQDDSGTKIVDGWKKRGIYF